MSLSQFLHTHFLMILFTGWFEVQFLEVPRDGFQFGKRGQVGQKVEAIEIAVVATSSPKSTC